MQSAWQLRIFILLVFGLGSWGCLSPDPILESPEQAASKTETESEAQPTSAPLTIDPDILKNRTFGEAPMLAKKVQEGK